VGGRVGDGSALDTATTNEADAVFPDGSVAVHVTVLAPTGNCDPDGGRHVTVTEPELSLATGTG
jgi:hypothetical protein